MSAQAVLSVIAPALPAAPRGRTGGSDAPGFDGLLAALLSGEGDPVASDRASVGDGPSAEGAGPAKTADPEPLVLPGVLDAKTPEPQVLPGVVAAKGPEPLILPDTEEGKGPEPQVLPGATVAKGPAPLVLPGTAQVKAPEPQVLPDTTQPKGPEPQVLPGATAGKEPRPQVLPGTAPDDVLLPLSAGGETMEVAPEGPSAGHGRPGAAPAQTATLQPTPPPLRPLAERTSKPLDESSPAAPPPAAADAKATGPATTPPSAPADQPVKPAPQAAPGGTATQVDTAAPPAEEAPTSGSTTAPAEAVAPTRDHSLSTLSRATIDATAQVAAQILRKLEGRSTRFEIALRPAELGRVDVKLDIDAEGRLAARLAFDNPAAATDLRGRADELRRQLEAAGFQLADDAFEFAERDSSSSAFDRGQNSRHGSNRAFAAAARLNAETDIAQPPQWLALSLSPSGVDLKV